MPKAKRRPAPPRVDASRSAVSRLPPEIWKMVGEFIQVESTLQNLVLVCRDFRALFSRARHEKKVYHLSKSLPKRPRYMSLPAGINHLKEFGVVVDEFGRRRTMELRGPEYDVKWNNNYARYIARLIKEAPELESFWWYDQANERYNPTLILRDKILIEALKSAPKLKKLHISFENVYLYGRPESFRCFLDFSGFRNLTSLEIYNFYGRLPLLRRDLASLLSRCPQLSQLGLGLACHCDGRYSPESVVMEGSYDFLEKLCVEYTHYSNEALNLRTLKLGWGMCVFESTEPTRGNYLNYLFRQGNLKTLHIFNGLIHLGDLLSEAERMKIDWHLLQECTRLHQLAITRIDRHVLDWLNETAVNVRELIFTDKSAVRGQVQSFLPGLKQPLTLLYAIEDGYRRVKKISDSVSDISELSSDDHEDEDNTYFCAACGDYHEIDHLSETDSSPSEEEDDEPRPDGVSGPAMTILDRLMDHGADLTHLAVSLDLTEQWEHFIDLLGSLSKLTHLRVVRRTWKYGKWPDAEHSLWPGVVKSREIARRYASLVKAACPSIQFVRFSDWTWQFTAQRKVPKTRKKDPSSHFEMIELSYDEVYEIPIFVLDPLNNQAGLPLRRLKAPCSEEEWDEFDRLYQAQKAMYIAQGLWDRDDW